MSTSRALAVDENWSDNMIQSTQQFDVVRGIEQLTDDNAASNSNGDTQ